MSDNSILSSLVNGYKPHDAETTSKSGKAKDNSLGNKEFLTLLVAQLEIRIPLIRQIRNNSPTSWLSFLRLNN